MFLNIKTLQWLHSKDQKERDKIITQHPKSVKDLELKYKARILEIGQKRKIAIQEKIIQKENAERERVRRQEKTTNDIVMYVLWQSELEVDNVLAS